MLDKQQLRFLRTRAHALKPVVRVGARGITPALLAELEQALDAHQLLKLKIDAIERAERDGVVAELVRRSGAELVQRIGKVAVLYRANPEHRRALELPRA